MPTFSQNVTVSSRAFLLTPPLLIPSLLKNKQHEHTCNRRERSARQQNAHNKQKHERQLYVYGCRRGRGHQDNNSRHNRRRCHTKNSKRKGYTVHRELRRLHQRGQGRERRGALPEAQCRCSEDTCRGNERSRGTSRADSTDYVFGGDPYNTPCREDQKGTPTGVYGKTKLEGEKNIEAVGCDYVIIRTAWLYSEYGRNFVKTMLNLTATKPRLTVVFDQAGTPTYAYDLAVAIKTVLADYEKENPKNGYSKRGTYHFSNEGRLLVVRLHQENRRIGRAYGLRHRTLPQRRVPQSGHTSGLFSS